MHRLIIYIILISASLGVKAQDSMSIASTEEISKDLFLKKDWNQLIDFSKKALSDNIDFYFLRLRLGIAYYELKEYRGALFHFEKAYSMSSEYQVLKEYLYYCYIFTEQYSQALKITNSFSSETLKKTKTEDPSYIFLLHSEYGIKFSSNDSLYKPLNYFQVGFSFRIGRTITAYNAYSYLTQITYYGTLVQQQYYLTINIPLKNSWVLSPAIHYMNYSDNDSSKSSTTSIPGILSFALSKNLKDFLFSISATVSNLNNENQFQENLNVKYFPLPDNLLSVNAGTGFFTNSAGITLKLLPYAGFKYYFTPRFSISSTYLLAGVSSFTEHNGYLINNSPDITHDRLSFNGDLNIYKNFNIYIIYLHETKTAKYISKNYTYDMALAGIKLIF